MNTRNYNQLCGLAFALDRVGERWTLLIIRELIAGPRRFKDLLRGLPDISTNILTERLKQLEHDQLVRRVILPAPASASAYELTELGHGLEPMLLELGRWGSQFIPADGGDCAILPLSSYALTPKTFFRPELAQHLDEHYNLFVDDEVLQVWIHAGKIDIKQGVASNAVASLHTSMPLYLQLLNGQLTVEQAIQNAQAHVDGDPSALQRFFAVCAIGG